MRTSTARPGSAIRAGDAWIPSSAGVRITGGPDVPTITDGPFAEGAEVAGGYYIFEAENLDEALALPTWTASFGANGPAVAAARTLVGRSHRRRGRPGSLHQGIARLAARRRAGQRRRMARYLARDRALDRLRRESVCPGKELAAVVDEIRAWTDKPDVPHQVRDGELRMMFACAHPALDPASQLALTLRLISGLTVAEIARALLQSEAAVGQRITRAKNKVRHANILLRVPPQSCWPNALHTSSPASTRCSPRATGRRRGRRRSATSCATKESGSPVSSAH
jgi:RNA polymerase sigma factor (sigma-70 family)